MAIRIIVLVLFLASFLAGPALAADPKRPNVVLIYVDDMGYGDLGCYGAKGGHTPNLDRMAQGGRASPISTSPRPSAPLRERPCLPAAIPNRIGMLGALGPHSMGGIDSREKTIAEVLKTRDYATAIYGKWHLGHQAPFLPTRHGFDDYFGLPY